MNFDKKKRIVVIGCGRSGTKFISKHLGLGHETRITERGIACWHAVVDKNPYYTIQPNDYVVHQIRNPIDTISSCHAILMKESWDLIINNIKDMNKDDSLLLKCMKYWYYWNQMAEKRASKSYKVEDLSSEVPKDVNSRKDSELYRKISWNDMQNEDKNLANRIKSLAIKYGYNL